MFQEWVDNLVKVLVQNDLIVSRFKRTLPVIPDESPARNCLLEIESPHLGELIPFLLICMLFRCFGKSFLMTVQGFAQLLLKSYAAVDNYFKKKISL